jgi:hypothetical protein
MGSRSTSFRSLPRLPVADADTMLSNVVIGAMLGQFKRASADELSQVSIRGAHARDVALRPIAKCEARPLVGIWATSHCLHNGSVPNLDALLMPVAEHPKSFSIGARKLDAFRVGYLTDIPGFPRFNVT